MPEIGVVNHAVFTQDGEYLIAATSNVLHWFRRKSDTYAHVEQHDADPFQVTGLLISPSGRLIIAGGYQNHATLYERTLRIFGFDVPLLRSSDTD